MSLLDTLAGLLPGRKAPEQVGGRTAPGQVNPAAHLGAQAPEVMGGIEWTGADYDQVATRPAPPRASRVWRQPANGDIPATNTDVGLATPQHQAAQDHLTHGQPDPRRGAATGFTGPPADYAASPEHPVNVRDLVDMNPEPAPARNRQGFTGEDPTRAARFQPTYFLRPFDQAIAHHGVTKASQPNPLAARPPERSRLAGGRPSPSGSTGTGMEPVGPQPNTRRVVPGAWDVNLTNKGAEAPPTRRWGLR